MLVSLWFSFFADLPPPEMSYSTPGHPVMVGQRYSINCSATIVENVLGDTNPTVDWKNPSGDVISTTSPDVSVGQVVKTSNGASLELIFHSFQTEAVQMGVYTCHGCINVPKASIDKCTNIRADTNVGVTCECFLCSI